MITKKQWQEFQTYRAKQDLSFYSSDEYKSLIERRSEVLKPSKNKFLWFEWESAPDPFIVFMRLDRIDRLERLYRTLPIYYVPEETVEECLNWLARKDN